MPEELFKTSGKGGTHTKTCLIVATKKSSIVCDQKIFMAEAKWCGHDSRGNSIPHNDLPIILKNYLDGIDMVSNGKSHLGYLLKRSDISNFVLAPRYYNPEPGNELELLKDSHDLIYIGDLVDQGCY